MLREALSFILKAHLTLEYILDFGGCGINGYRISAESHIFTARCKYEMLFRSGHIPSGSMRSRSDMPLAGSAILS